METKENNLNNSNNAAKFVTYCRVSTAEQGESGLGLEAQLSTCRAYVEKVGGEIIGEFHDVKSGSSSNRRGLNDALETAKKNDATIVFAKLDRLSRSVEYAHAIRNSGVQLYFCDFPQINSLTFSILIAVAQYEKELGQKRTKDALSQIQANIAKDGYHVSKAGNAITKLGQKVNGQNMDNAHAASIAAKRAAVTNNPIRRRQYALICDLKSRGSSFEDICGVLNATGERMPKGGEWTAREVKRALEGWGKFFDFITIEQ